METTSQVAYGPGVDEATVRLAQAIRALPEWLELQEARDRFRTDPEVTAIMARYRRAFGQWTAARKNGGSLAGPDAMELANSQQQLENHPVYLRQHEATIALIAALHSVNQLLSTELGLDFAANAAPRGGGCCG